MVEDNDSVFSSEFEYIPPCERLDIALNKIVRNATEWYGRRLMGFNVHYYPGVFYSGCDHYAAMIEWLLCDEKEDDASS